MGVHWLAKACSSTSPSTSSTQRSERRRFTTYPIVDPEIVVIATNPVGGAGIGIDPLRATSRRDLSATDERAVHRASPTPSTSSAWKALPGFDNHHDERGGTYVEDCGGAGGNICFASTPRDRPGAASRRRLQPVRPRRPRVRSLPHARPRRRRRRRPVGGCADERHHGVRRRSARDEQVRVDARRRRHRDAHEPLPRRQRRPQGRRRRPPATSTTRRATGGNAFQTQHPRDHCYASEYRRADRLPAARPRLAPRPPHRLGARSGEHERAGPDCDESLRRRDVSRRLLRGRGHGRAPVEVARRRNPPRTTTTPTATRRRRPPRSPRSMWRSKTRESTTRWWKP